MGIRKYHLFSIQSTNNLGLVKGQFPFCFCKTVLVKYMCREAEHGFIFNLQSIKHFKKNERGQNNHSCLLSPLAEGKGQIPNAFLFNLALID